MRKLLLLIALAATTTPSLQKNEEPSRWMEKQNQTVHESSPRDMPFLASPEGGEGPTPLLGRLRAIFQKFPKGHGK